VRLLQACFTLSLALIFSLLRRLPLARFALPDAFKLAPMFNQALIVRAAGVDAVLNARIIWIAHLSVSFEKMILSRGSQSNACAGRVAKSPQDTALRAYKGIWKIVRNALGIFSLDLHQAFLPADRHLTERKAIGLAQLRSEFFSGLDCPQRSSSG
jgi:hypothetical protein